MSSFGLYLCRRGVVLQVGVEPVGQGMDQAGAIGPQHILYAVLHPAHVFALVTEAACYGPESFQRVAVSIYARECTTFLRQN